MSVKLLEFFVYIWIVCGNNDRYRLNIDIYTKELPFGIKDPVSVIYNDTLIIFGGIINNEYHNSNRFELELNGNNPVWTMYSNIYDEILKDSDDIASVNSYVYGNEYLFVMNPIKAERNGLYWYDIKKRKWDDSVVIPYLYDDKCMCLWIYF